MGGELAVPIGIPAAPWPSIQSSTCTFVTCILCAITDLPVSIWIALKREETRNAAVEFRKANQGTGAPGKGAGRIDRMYDKLFRMNILVRKPL